MESATTILTLPGGNSSAGATSSSATVVELELVRERRPFLRKRGSLGAVEGDFQHAQAEDRALQPHRRERDRAAAALEPNVVDRVSVVAELDRNGHLVAAKRVLPLRVRVGVLEHPVPPRGLVVIQDHLAVKLVKRHYVSVAARCYANSCRARSTPATRRSTSSAVE